MVVRKLKVQFVEPELAQWQMAILFGNNTHLDGMMGVE
jgi:hypothetical protein